MINFLPMWNKLSDKTLVKSTVRRANYCKKVNKIYDANAIIHAISFIVLFDFNDNHYS